MTRPPSRASWIPFSVSGMSVHPAYMFCLFQVLSPWRIRISFALPLVSLLCGMAKSGGIVVCSIAGRLTVA
eukprot:33901_1